MHTYTLRYAIKNKYEKLVKKAFFQLMVIPAQTERQKLISISTYSSLKETEYKSDNYLGFKTLQYSSQEPIHDFYFELEAEVQIDEVNPYDFLSEDGVKEHQLLNDLNFYLEHSKFLVATDLTKMNPKELKNEFRIQKNQNVFDYLVLLNQNIFQLLNYQAGVTTTDTTAHEVWELKTGVCQDYAHLFLAIARLNGIPARYTSGYLNQGEDLMGTSQTHAWVEAYVPFVGWIGFDPTNNLLVNHHYIKIAHGTDYRDCSPITGILETSGDQINTHAVSVINQ